MITTITSILIALSLLLGSTGAAVYAAQDSLPEDALYPVKTTGEQLHYLFAPTPKDRLDLALQHVARRMNEVQALLGNDDPLGEQVQTRVRVRIEENLDAALVAAAEVEDTEQALDQIKDALERHIRDTDRVQSQTKIPENLPLLAMVRNTFQHRLKVVNASEIVPLQFKHAFQNKSPKVAEEELLGMSGDDPDAADEPDGPDDDPTEDVTPKGNTYQGKNETGETEDTDDRGEGPEYQYQAPQVQRESPGTGEPQNESAPVGPNDGTGQGEMQQNGGSDGDHPESGSGAGSDNGSGGNTDSGSGGGSGGKP